VAGLSILEISFNGPEGEHRRFSKDVDTGWYRDSCPLVFAALADHTPNPRAGDHFLESFEGKGWVGFCPTGSEPISRNAGINDFPRHLG